MNLPKFIITLNGVFRLGMVNQHKDLLNRVTNASAVPDSPKVGVKVGVTP